MYSLRPSPRMQTCDVERLDRLSTYNSIQVMKNNFYRLRGCLTLPDGRIRLVFYEEFGKNEYVAVYRMTVRLTKSFSSHL